MKDILKKHSESMIDLFLEDSIKAFDKRNIFKETMGTKENLVIIGLRRIGKTQLLKELTKKYSSIVNHDINEKSISKQLESGIDKVNQIIVPTEASLKTKKLKNIFIIKFDSINFIRHLDNPEKIEEIFSSLKEIIKEEKISLLLIDEIQVIEKWTFYLKDIADTFQSKDFRMIITGSNSNELLESSEIGIGRFQPRIFGVLSYNEAQVIHGDLTLAEYIDYKHFPHYDRTQYNEEVPLAVLEKAFSSTKNKKSTLYKVLISIIDNTGAETNQTNISKNSEVNKTHIRSYIDGLIESQLIFEVKNRYIQNTNSKFYPLIPGANRLFNQNKEFSIANDSDKGKLFENFVLIQILSKINRLPNRINIEYFRNKEGSEIDFIINNHAVEVKHSNKIKDLSHYEKICLEQKFKTLNFIYLGESKSETKNELEINYINWKEIDKYGFK